MNLHTILTNRYRVASRRRSTGGTLDRVTDNGTRTRGADLAEPALERSETPSIGNEVRATDGQIGHVFAVITTETNVPRYIVVSTGRFWRRHPVIAIDLIAHVDANRILVRGKRRNLRRLPESVPLIV